jgi:hypothetical protein
VKLLREQQKRLKCGVAKAALQVLVVTQRQAFDLLLGPPCQPSRLSQIGTNLTAEGIRRHP